MNYLGKINSFVQVGVHDGVMHVHLSIDDKLEIQNIIFSFGYYLIEKKNDTIAIRKDILTSGFIFVYAIFRIYDSVTSRIINLLNSNKK